MTRRHAPLTVIVGMIVLAAISLTGNAGNAGDQSIYRKKFGDWTVECTVDRMTDVRSCNLYAKASGNEDALIVLFAYKPLLRQTDPPQERIFVSSSKPLAVGGNEGEGKIRIDREEAFYLKAMDPDHEPLEPATCPPMPIDSSGNFELPSDADCEAGKRRLIDQMKSGSQLLVRVSLVDGGNADGEISLRNFDHAYSSWTQQIKLEEGRSNSLIVQPPHYPQP